MMERFRIKIAIAVIALALCSLLLASCSKIEPTNTDEPDTEQTDDTAGDKEPEGALSEKESETASGEGQTENAVNGDEEPEGATSEVQPETVSNGDEESESVIETEPQESDEAKQQKSDESMEQQEPTVKEIVLTIISTEVETFWEDNESVDALKAELEKGDITIDMSMYGGFEQVGPLGVSLPRNDVQVTTTYGDIVLYSGNQIVLFYGSNSWSYTKLGRMQLSQEELSDLLGSGDVTLTLSLRESTD